MHSKGKKSFVDNFRKNDKMRKSSLLNSPKKSYKERFSTNPNTPIKIKETQIDRNIFVSRVHEFYQLHPEGLSKLSSQLIEIFSKMSFNLRSQTKVYNEATQQV